MSRVVVEWPQLECKVRVQLDPARNRVLTDLFLKHLPYTVVQNHALVSGDHLYHTCPIIELVHAKADYVEPDRTITPNGTVFLSHLVHFGMKYGELTEYLPAAPVGKVIDEDLAIVKEVGAALWEVAYVSHKIIHSHVYQEGGDTNRERYLPAAGKVSHPDVQALVDEIWQEANRIAVQVPEELLAIHKGDIRSRAGGKGQYFTTMVFVNGEQRPLGYCAVGGLLSASRCRSATLDMLREITPHFLVTPAKFLEYCGLHKQCEYVMRTHECLPLLRDKEEYHTLMAPLYIYTNLLNAWSLHLFPWNAAGQKYDYNPPTPSRDRFLQTLQR